MYMVRHNDPGKQMVTVTIKVQEGVLGKLANAWISKVTRAITGIQIILKPLTLFGISDCFVLFFLVERFEDCGR